MIHILPTNEDHEDTTSCSCEPEVEYINGNMLVIHNSFDNREVVEKAKEVLSLPQEKNKWRIHETI